MRRFNRLPEPDFLRDNWLSWGIAWEQRRASDTSAVFSWHQINGFTVNSLLMPLLKQQTQSHCSFCDQFPISPPSIDTIEHFRPKSIYPRLAYNWSNLYFCCMFCQQKNSSFDDLALQPDDPDYEFDRFFRWDYITGRIEINNSASDAEKSRAQATISLYRLNIEHPSLRRRELLKRSKDLMGDIDDFAYRDFVR